MQVNGFLKLRSSSITKYRYHSLHLFIPEQGDESRDVFKRNRTSPKYYDANAAS